MAKAKKKATTKQLAARYDFGKKSKLAAELVRLGKKKNIKEAWKAIKKQPKRIDNSKKRKSVVIGNKLKTYSGKEVLKGSKWYPVTVKAYSLKEANEKVSQKNTRSKLRGRFSRTD